MFETNNTIAEIAVAVVGFVAIVLALGKSSHRSELDQILIKNLISEPIVVVMFALMPSILAEIPLAVDLNLHISLALFALVHAYLTIWVYIRFIPHFGNDFGRAMPSTVCGLAALLCISQLLAVLGLIQVSLSFLYVFGLYWLLGMCFLNFLLLFTGSDAVKQNAK